MRKYPQFKDEALKQVAIDLAATELEIEGLNRLKGTLEKRLDSSVYDWRVHYELKVRYHNGDKQVEAWLESDYVPEATSYYFGKLEETLEEAMGGIKKAKENIASLTDKEVTIPHHGRALVLDYNITRAIINKGLYSQENINLLVDEKNHERSWPRGL
ncbi:MAG: hypothetical protein V1645_03580 [archaeon]